MSVSIPAYIQKVAAEVMAMAAAPLPTVIIATDPMIWVFLKYGNKKWDIKRSASARKRKKFLRR